MNYISQVVFGWFLVISNLEFDFGVCKVLFTALNTVHKLFKSTFKLKHSLVSSILETSLVSTLRLLVCYSPWIFQLRQDIHGLSREYLTRLMFFSLFWPLLLFHEFYRDCHSQDPCENR